MLGVNYNTQQPQGTFLLLVDIVQTFIIKVHNDRVESEQTYILVQSICLSVLSDTVHPICLTGAQESLTRGRHLSRVMII